ncbi:MAG: DUF2953 domain-containing protein [Clostridia bacterium]|nr:DUF2953 domain-containing protein [Clostridia bacterium]
MTFLYVLLGIVLLIVLLCSFKVSVILEMDKYNKITLRYLFLKFVLLDSSEPKKEKKQKKEDAQEEVSAEANEEASATETQKGNSLLKQLYKEQGYDGIVKMLSAIKTSLGSFFHKLYKTFTINEFYLTMRVTGDDAADTALKYGKLSSWLFPVLGKVASTCKMKKYDVDISPDFLAVKNEASLYANVSIVPIRVTNAAVVLAVQLLFKVLFKILFANNNAKKSVNIKNNSVENTMATDAKTNV